MTTIKRHFLHLLLAASWLMTLAACSKDDDPIVAYRQDLAELATDHNGRVAKLILDNADTLAVTNKEAITQTLVPDTAYRVRAVFLKEAQEAEVVSLQTVFCMAPLAEKPAEMKADAITQKPSGALAAISTCWYPSKLLGLRNTKSCLWKTASPLKPTAQRCCTSN